MAINNECNKQTKTEQKSYINSNPMDRLVRSDIKFHFHLQKVPFRIFSVNLTLTMHKNPNLSVKEQKLTKSLGFF